jgi:hypothetical protein
MKYKDLVNDLPNDKIIELIKTEQLSWFDLVDMNNQSKLKTFTQDQLLEAGFEKALKKYYYLLEISMNFPRCFDICIIANKYFNEHLFESAKSSSALLKKFLDSYPTKKDELITTVDYFNEVTIDLLFGERSETIARLINANKVCMRSLNKHIDKFPIAEINTLIDYKYYEHTYEIDCLLTLFPRDIPFPEDIAQQMVKVSRNSFLKLPLHNQLNSKLFVFATNHIIYGDNWTVYDEVDPKNIPLSQIDDRILNFIETDYDGLIIAKAFVAYKNQYIQHKNIQKLLSHQDYATHFAEYKSFLSDDQKYLSGIYTKENFPLHLEIKLGYQDDDVLIELIKQTEDNYQIVLSLHYLLERNIKINDCFDKDIKNKIIGALNNLLSVGSVSRIIYFNDDTIIKVIHFVLDNSLDFKLLGALERTCKNKKDFDAVLMIRLTNLEKLAYLDFSSTNV